MSVALTPDHLNVTPRQQILAGELAEQRIQFSKVTGESRVYEGETWIVPPLYWLWHHTECFDEHWEKKGTQPYRPMDRLPYLPWLFELLMQEPTLFIAKSREMRVSWSLAAYCVWRCQVFARTRAMIQSQKQSKAAELVKGSGAPGYARTLWERQPEWLRKRFPLAGDVEDMPSDRLTWANSSTLQGVPSGADQVRLYHPTIFVVDEAAHIDDFQASYDAARPVAQQIIAASSAAPGWFGEVCSL